MFFFSAWLTQPHSGSGIMCHRNRGVCQELLLPWHWNVPWLVLLALVESNSEFSYLIGAFPKALKSRYRERRALVWTPRAVTPLSASSRQRTFLATEIFQVLFLLPLSEQWFQLNVTATWWHWCCPQVRVNNIKGVKKMNGKLTLRDKTLHSGLHKASGERGDSSSLCIY